MVAKCFGFKAHSETLTECHNSRCQKHFVINTLNSAGYYYYSCGLSTINLCVPVCVCVRACVSVYTITEKISPISQL